MSLIDKIREMWSSIERFDKSRKWARKGKYSDEMRELLKVPGAGREILANYGNTIEINGRYYLIGRSNQV